MTGGVARGFVVRGRVPGVGFRWWTRRQAESLELGGAVWNRPDGAVEVHVVGSPPEVERFLEALHRGPPMADVEAVEEVAADPACRSAEFRVLR